MTKEEMISEIDETLGKANVKLYQICGDKKPLEDVVLTVEYGDSAVLSSGKNEILRVSLEGDAMKAMKSLKRHMWDIVDSTREELCPGSREKPNASTAATDKRGTDKRGTFSIVMDEIASIVEKANKILFEITEGGFPFAFDDVKMAVESDSVALYVNCGATTICVAPRYGQPHRVVERIEDAIRNEIDAIRASVSDRGGLQRKAACIKESDEKVKKAAGALAAAGLDPSEVLPSIDPDGMKSVVSAVKAAVRDANNRICALRGGRIAVSEVFGRRTMLRVHGYSGGVVVTEGAARPCMVISFPAVWSNSAVDKLITFAVADIAAIGDSRCRYYNRIRSVLDAKETMREQAAKREQAKRMESEVDTMLAVM